MDEPEVLLVETLSEGREHTGMFIFSCFQSPGAMDGLRCRAVHFTDRAAAHPNFEKFAATISRNLQKSGY